MTSYSCGLQHITNPKQYRLWHTHKHSRSSPHMGGWRSSKTSLLKFTDTSVNASQYFLCASLQSRLCPYPSIQCPSPNTPNHLSSLLEAKDRLCLPLLFNPQNLLWPSLSPLNKYLPNHPCSQNISISEPIQHPQNDCYNWSLLNSILFYSARSCFQITVVPSINLI